ncbi:primosomal protein [Tenacibaculum phage Gundel_1]|uniref:Replication protein n=1 Tax=Tenacibaculum phage Gundel_1 TaxID=2745672 RepID=A0A8E4ZGG8_9CAUD|nr:primosomal protein [Tenacibaculum phage Gundel_1]QQV91469.1 replication protein [Tenacibaculum phage Gundel_1]
MNYIEIINNFWAYTEDKDISSSDTSVYFALLKYNNSLNWIKEFRCDYAVICQYSRVSKNTFYKSIDNLSDLKLIQYEKGVRNHLKPKVSILKIKNRKGIIKEQKGNTEGTQEEQKGNLYKLLNIETIKLLNNKNYSKKINDNLKIWLGLEEGVFNFRKELLSLGAKEDLANDWLKVRKNKKASNTKTAFKLFHNQVIKSKKEINEILTICIAKDWKSFNASWKIETQNSNTNDRNYNFNNQPGGIPSVPFETNRD